MVGPVAKRQHVIDTMKIGSSLSVTDVSKRKTTSGAPAMPNVRKQGRKRGKHQVGDGTLRRKGFNI